jgi:hypothetical protein
MRRGKCAPILKKARFVAGFAWKGKRQKPPIAEQWKYSVSTSKILSPIFYTQVIFLTSKVKD